jgi:hypothetical protein
MKTILILTTSALLAATGGNAMTAASAKPYTKNICIVSDNELGSMGRVIIKTYGDQEVKFCCKPCIGKFEKNPEKYLKKL